MLHQIESLARKMQIGSDDVKKEKMLTRQRHSILSLILAALTMPTTHSGEPSKARWATLKELEKTIEETNVITVWALLPLISGYAVSSKFVLTRQKNIDITNSTIKLIDNKVKTALKLQTAPWLPKPPSYFDTETLEELFPTNLSPHTEISYPSPYKLIEKWYSLIITEKEGKEIANINIGENHEIRRGNRTKLYKNSIAFVDTDPEACKFASKLKAKNFLKNPTPKLLLEQPNNDTIIDFFISPCNKIIFTLGTRLVYRWEKKRVHEVTEE